MPLPDAEGMAVRSDPADRPGRSWALPVESAGRPDDDEGVTHFQVRPDPAFGLLELYDDALPHVYGYLLARCGDTGLAEELTAESFLAAVHAVRKPGEPRRTPFGLLADCVDDQGSTFRLWQPAD